MCRIPPRRNYYRAPRRGRVGQWGNVQAESRSSANPEIESEDRTPNVEQPPPPVIPVLQFDPRVLAETICHTSSHIARDGHLKPTIFFKPIILYLKFHLLRN